ncbi:MAG TPA: hypothetical protein VMB47_06885 [Candidatus Aquilonibacter sp.]|nr:hypothetical protein [Candidatus Aquilonibacter sp.]
MTSEATLKRVVRSVTPRTLRNWLRSPARSTVFSAGYFKVWPNEPGSELAQICSLTLDDITERFGRPTHIKIDVEGHEAAALDFNGRRLEATEILAPPIARFVARRENRS